MKIRRALFSGSWYPSRASECEDSIKQFIETADRRKKKPGHELCGGIVPHAGWYYSGQIACNVIHRLKGKKEPDVIILFGMHLHKGNAGYIMPEGAWETPFGEIPVDEKLAEELKGKFDFIIESHDNFIQDNTIELQLPFIKYFFPDSRIVAMGVPPAKLALEAGVFAAEASKRLGYSVKVLGSTDLTHYGANYGFSPKGRGKVAHDWVRNENDRRVIDKMVAMDPSAVIQEAGENSNACCAGAVAAALAAGKALGAENAYEIAYATSYEKSPGDSFVGYTGIVF
jgi:AmmeMemoRadiSam system protein B